MESTSVYLNAWRAIYRLLCEESWPNLTKPMPDSFIFGCTYSTQGPPDESVLIVTDPTEMADQTWAATSIGSLERDEKFVIQLVVSTFRPHQTWLAAGARLEELTSVVEQMVHRTSRLQDRQRLVPELATVLKGWQVARVTPEIFPLSNGKFGALADIRILVEARIKPTVPTL